jgi:hypothetical protein
MRIVSDFQDYYDAAAAFGSDSTRIFERRSNTTELNTRQAPEPWSRLIAHKEQSVARFPLTSEELFRFIAVCFCGKIYWGLQIPAATQPAGTAEELEYVTFYDHQSAYDAIRLHPVETLRTGYMSFGTEPKLKQRLVTYFSLNGSDAIEQRLVEDKVAIAILMPCNVRSTLVTNARLADVQFYKVFDAWSAFQELDMFWGGVLAPEAKPIATVGDKDRLLKHGFDRKSFRKAPTRNRH